jgi:hypothetical protein
MNYRLEVSFATLEDVNDISFSFIYLFIYSYVHTMFGSFLPTSPAPPCPLTPSIPSRNYFALISNFVEDRV